MIIFIHLFFYATNTLSLIAIIVSIIIRACGIYQSEKSPCDTGKQNF